MTIATRIALDEFMNLGEEKPALEYACGEVTQKPMPGWSHAAIQGFLQIVLGQFLLRTGLGRVVPELRCIFGPTGRERAFVPDLVYIAKGNLTGERFLYRAPDLAIEILSPDQHRAHFLDKVQFYLLNGVRLVWVIDPATRSIAVLAPGQEGLTLTSGATLDGDDVLPGFSVTVDEIFAQVEI
jgi:Uma2 family endonuclease